MGMELKSTGLRGFVEERELGYMDPLVQTANEMLVQHTGAGSDYHGWVDLPVQYDREEFARIKAAVKKSNKTVTC